MTAPVQEPTTGRDLSGLGYGSRQLFRRPAPQSAGGVSCFRAYFFGTNSVSGAGTRDQMAFNVWENCDTAVFDENLLGGDLASVELLVPGHIIIQWGFRFDQPSGNMQDSICIEILDSDPVWGPNVHSVIHGRAGNGTNAFEGADSMIFTQTLSRTYPTLDIFDSGSQFPQTFTFHMSQITGTARNIVFSFLDIQYQAATICTGPIES